MTTGWEIAANAFNAGSVVLAGRNSVHTWWVGIMGCMLFGWVFYRAQLFADVTLQAFFIITSAAGWWNWCHGKSGTNLPVRRVPAGWLPWLMLVTIAVALGYGWVLRRFTSAFAPFVDSVVLGFSVLGQLLLMGRRIETWWCWLVVNSVAVPLFLVRGLHVTAVLYAGFWINAWLGLRHWRCELNRNA